MLNKILIIYHIDKPQAYRIFNLMIVQFCAVLPHSFCHPGNSLLRVHCHLSVCVIRGLERASKGPFQRRCYAFTALCSLLFNPVGGSSIAAK